MLDFMSVDIST